MKSLLWLSFLSCREQCSQVQIYGKARLDRIQGGIGKHLGGIHKQFLPPDQSCLLALIEVHQDGVGLT